MIHRDKLATLGIPFKYPVVKTGIVGSIGKGEPVIALRADIDALPIEVTASAEPAMCHSVSAGRIDVLHKGHSHAAI